MAAGLLTKLFFSDERKAKETEDKLRNIFFQPTQPLFIGE
jgi:hypothetical protein